VTEQDYIDQAYRFAADLHVDPSGLELLGKIVYEAEEAKQLLRKAGFGWTGLSLIDTVREVIKDSGEK